MHTPPGVDKQRKNEDFITLFTTINADCLIVCHENIIEGLGGGGLNPLLSGHPGENLRYEVYSSNANNSHWKLPMTLGSRL